MAIATLNERTSKLAAAKAALADLWRDLLDTADGLLRDAVAARRAQSPAMRLTRISAGAHVARALKLAGHSAQDLESMRKHIAAAGHRFAGLRAALHVAEKWIEHGSWRITPPETEAGLLAALTAPHMGGDGNADGLQAELSEFGWNVYMVLALAYTSVGVRAPELFGKLSVEEEHAQASAASQLVDDTLAALRAMPQVVAGLAERYGVEIRPGVDAVPPLFDAALATASRA